MLGHVLLFNPMCSSVLGARQHPCLAAGFVFSQRPSRPSGPDESRWTQCGMRAWRLMNAWLCPFVPLVPQMMQRPRLEPCVICCACCYLQGSLGSLSGPGIASLRWTRPRQITLVRQWSLGAGVGRVAGGVWPSFRSFSSFHLALINLFLINAILVMASMRDRR